MNGMRWKVFVLSALVCFAVIVPGLSASNAAGSTSAGKGVRYIDPVFSKLTVQKDILFKEARNDKGVKEKLLLDVYQPSGDKVAKRPAIIWVHGGGFTSGSKSNFLEKSLAIEFAKKGYVTLCINYRLRSNPKNDWLGTFRDTTEDAASALSWLIKNSARYRIDESHIAFGGHSAGASIVTNLNYSDENKIKWNKKSVFSVIDLSGGVLALGQPRKNDPPCIVVHGTSDTDVPYSVGEQLAQQLKDAGVPCYFHPVRNAPHNLTGNFYEVVDFTTKYLYKGLTGKVPNIKVREGILATSGLFIKERLKNGIHYSARQIKFVADGKLDEWTSCTAIPLNRIKDDGDGLPAKSRFSGTARIGWNKADAKRIYLSADITDSSVSQSSDSWWLNSSLEFVADIGSEKVYCPILQWGLAADGKKAFGMADSKNLEWTVSRSGNKYIYEAAVDISKLDPGLSGAIKSFRAGSGLTIGLSIEYNVSNKGTRLYQVGWTPGATLDPRNFGNLTFE